MVTYEEVWSALAERSLVSKTLFGEYVPDIDFSSLARGTLELESGATARIALAAEKALAATCSPPNRSFSIMAPPPIKYVVVQARCPLVEIRKPQREVPPATDNQLVGIAAFETASRPAVARVGKLWSLSFEEESLMTSHRIGFLYLSEMLSRPGVPFAATHLLELASGGKLKVVLRREPIRIDRRTRAECVERLTELREGISEAADRGEFEAAVKLEEERDELIAYLRKGSDRRGRSRRFPGHSEQARNSVCRAVRRAVSSLSHEMPKLHKHLLDTLDYGQELIYLPQRSDTNNS